MISSRKAEAQMEAIRLCFAMSGGEVRPMAKGKYEQWLTPEGLGRIEAWCRDGLDDKQLAAKMGISPSTLYAWQKEHPEISEAATRGRAGAREQILNSLYKKATGFSITVKTPMRRRVSRDEDVIEIVEKEEYFPPDDRAARLWLNAHERQILRDGEDAVGAEREVEDLTPLAVLLSEGMSGT